MKIRWYGIAERAQVIGGCFGAFYLGPPHWVGAGLENRRFAIVAYYAEGALIFAPGELLSNFIGRRFGGIDIFEGDFWTHVNSIMRGLIFSMWIGSFRRSL